MPPMGHFAGEVKKGEGAAFPIPLLHCHPQVRQFCQPGPSLLALWEFGGRCQLSVMVTGEGTGEHLSTRGDCSFQTTFSNPDGKGDRALDGAGLGQDTKLFTSESSGPVWSESLGRSPAGSKGLRMRDRAVHLSDSSLGQPWCKWVQPH